MLFSRAETREARTYTLDEAAEFLQFDRTTLEYWLRMGHIVGSWDEEEEGWRVRPTALLDFLHEAGEPMPTGVTLNSDSNKVQPERVPAA
ncbi:MAG: helix-turn-helix domain-containing protein [Chloroflexota bacterium]